MNPQIERLVVQFQETCQNTRPLIAELQGHWQSHTGFLQMLRFLLSTGLSTADESNARQLQAFLTQLDQVLRDVDTIFATLQSYHHLGIAIEAIMQEYGETTEEQAV